MIVWEVRNEGGRRLELTAQPQAAERRIYDLKSAAEYMGLPVSTLRFHIREGHLRYVKFPGSRRYYVRPEDMAAFIAKSTHGATEDGQ